jgi:hypothetical protein
VAYTRLGTSLWDWKPWVGLECRERVLWLALYASPEAKRLVPGLFHGGLSVIAEAARMGSQDAHTALANLETRGLVERDPDSRVTRLTSLPDKGERPANGKVLRMLWRRWCDLPDSPLKVRHIALLHWLTEPLTENHQQVWDVTFGTIVVPDTVSVDNLGTNGQTSMFPDSEDTVSDTVSHTVGFRNPDPSSRNGSGKGGPGGRTRGQLPAEQPFTLKQMLDCLRFNAGDRVSLEVWDERRGEMLWELVEQCGRQGITLDDVALVGKWLKEGGGLDYRSDLNVNWLAKPGNFIDCVGLARTWRENGHNTGKRSTRKRGGLSAADLMRRAAQQKAEGQ